MPRRAEGPTPVANASARSGRCRVRSRGRAWQVGRREASGPAAAGRVAGGLQRLFRPFFG